MGNSDKSRKNRYRKKKRFMCNKYSITLSENSNPTPPPNLDIDTVELASCKKIRTSLTPF